MTGGAGFIGHHLVRALLAEGLDVAVLDDLSVGTRDRVDAAALLVVGDVRDVGALAEAMDRADVVFHLAARVSVRASVADFVDDGEINALGTIRTLEAASKAGVRRFVYASTMGVYGPFDAHEPGDERVPAEPLSPYGISKLAAERYALMMGEPLGFHPIALRYFNTYGTGQTLTPYVGVITIFVNALLDGEAPTIFGDGEQVRDYVHVSDIVRANLLALRRPDVTGAFNIGSGVGRSVNDLLGLLADRMGVRPEPRFVPARPTELRYSVAKITAAAEALGYAPQRTLEDSIDEVIDAIRDAR